MKLKKNQYKYIIILVILVIISLIIYKLNNNKEEKENIIDNKIKIVTNYSKFFTVNEVISKFISFLDAKNTDMLLKIIDEDFEKNNNITSSNVYNFFPKLDEYSHSFLAKEMFYEKINNNLEKYYVKGNLSKEDIDSFETIGEYYFIIKLDTEKRVFSLIPIDKEEYEGVINE